VGDLLAGYDRAGFLDEALDGGGEPSPLYRRLLGALDELGVDALYSRAELRDRLQHLRGVTFTISGEDGERERTLPLDLVPRVIDAGEWALVEAGLVQRVRALNAFLADVYAERRVLRDRVVPPRLVLGSPQYQRAAWGIRPPLGVHVHVAGLDLVRGDDGRCVPDLIRYHLGEDPLLDQVPTLLCDEPGQLEEICDRLLPQWRQNSFPSGSCMTTP
jgi:uncharacterized circularly permuted ATP-grasp superfamily protein